MPILSTAAQNASLDNDYGATKGPNAAAEHEVALFDGNPSLGGVELANTTEDDDNPGTFLPNGYAPVAIANDGSTWAPAEDGLKATAAPVQFPDALAPWDTATYFVLRDPATGDIWDYAPILTDDGGLTVTAAGDGPTLSLALFYGDRLDNLEA